MKKDKVASWTFFDVWNKTVDQGREERLLVPRDYIWASELGQSYVDRFLKMTGVTPTNPPNARAKRKFEAGNIWEWIVKLILIRAGVLVEAQAEVEYQYKLIDTLKVKGKLDFIAGVNPDWNKAREEINKMYLPETMTRAALAMVDNFASNYPDGLKKIVLEVKSKGSMVYEKIEKTGRGDPHHELQLFHYIKGLNMDEGHLVYVCRDDCRMIEIGIFKGDGDTEKRYIEDIKTITKYIRTGERPPLEPLIVFDKQSWKFSKNWKVEYSPYLTMLYGFRTPDEYYEKYSKKAAQYNRVFKRCIDKSKMTPANLEIVKQIKEQFPNFDTYVTQARKERGGEPF